MVLFYDHLYYKILSHDSPWSADGLRLKNFRIRPTVRPRIENKTRADTHIVRTFETNQIGF